MTKQLFQPSVKEDLNRPHNVTLTEGEISLILYTLEAQYSHILDNDTPEEVETIFSKLEGVVDNFYTEIENAQLKQPKPEWED